MYDTSHKFNIKFIHFFSDYKEEKNISKVIPVDSESMKENCKPANKTLPKCSNNNISNIIDSINARNSGIHEPKLKLTVPSYQEKNNKEISTDLNKSYTFEDSSAERIGNSMFYVQSSLKEQILEEYTDMDTNWHNSGRWLLI